MTIEGDVVCDNIEFNYHWCRKNVKWVLELFILYLYLFINFSRGSCLIRVQSVLYKVRLEQIKNANAQIVLKGTIFFLRSEDLTFLVH